MANFTGQLISTPQTLTGSWVNLGELFDIDTYRSVLLSTEITPNNSTGIKFRALIFINEFGGQLTKRIVRTQNADLIIPSEQEVGELSDSKTNLTFKIPDGATDIQIQVMAENVGATAGTIDEAFAARSYNSDFVGERIEITTIRTDTAFNPLPISLNTTTSTKILDANPNRNNVWVSNVGLTSEIWVKLQTALTDNDKKGILLPKNTSFRLFGDAVYTGEISAIASVNNPNIAVVEI